ncbi:hypothetical protein Ddc_21946 [Ditylenchus destructor]|nr:hypothetical protein Ddc_21946 [Ditylenchus destructor]
MVHSISASPPVIPQSVYHFEVTYFCHFCISERPYATFGRPSRSKRFKSPTLGGYSAVADAEINLFLPPEAVPPEYSGRRRCMGRPTLAANPAVSRLWRRDETRSALQPCRLIDLAREATPAAQFSLPTPEDLHVDLSAKFVANNRPDNSHVDLSARLA